MQTVSKITNLMHFSGPPLAHQEDESGDYLEQIDEEEEEKDKKSTENKNCDEEEEEETNNFFKLFRIDRSHLRRNFVRLTSNCISKLTPRPIPDLSIYKDTDDALETIDAYSRLYFPVTFSFVMLVYWTAYLYIMPDEYPHGIVDIRH